MEMDDTDTLHFHFHFHFHLAKCFVECSSLISFCLAALSTSKLYAWTQRTVLSKRSSRQKFNANDSKRTLYSVHTEFKIKWMTEFSIRNIHISSYIHRERERQQQKISISFCKCNRWTVYLYRTISGKWFILIRHKTKMITVMTIQKKISETKNSDKCKPQ